MQENETNRPAAHFADAREGKELSDPPRAPENAVPESTAPENFAPENAPLAAEDAASDGQAAVAASVAVEDMDLRYGSFAQVCKGGLLGFFIGLAVIVPGVSGSTVAIIFKLYHKLLYALGNLTRRFRTCLRFLVPIGIGVVIGFGLGFLAIQKLIEVSPFTVIALFAGLMLGAYPAVLDEVRGERKSAPRVLLFLAGLAVPVAVCCVSVFVVSGDRALEGLQIWHYVLFLVLGYAVAITQVVPGLSATALLMLFGYFRPLMESVHLSYWRENPAVFGVYACMIVGFVLGLITFSKLLSKLFVRRRAATYAVILGLALGSILTMFFNSDVYAVYGAWAAGAPMALDLVLGIVLFFAAAALSYLFVRYERKRGKMLS